MRRAGLVSNVCWWAQFDDPRDAVLGEKAAQVRARKQAAAGVHSDALHSVLAGPDKQEVAACKPSLCCACGLSGVRMFCTGLA